MQRRRLTVARIAGRRGTPGGLLALFLLTALLGGCDSTQKAGGAEQVKSSDSERARVVVPIPNDVSYTIIKADLMPGESIRLFPKRPRNTIGPESILSRSL